MSSDPAVPPVIGATATASDGAVLGTVTAVFLDDVTGEPSWVGLAAGQHAAAQPGDVGLIAPLGSAELAGGQVRLPVTADAVHSAPRPATPAHLSPEEELRLREHYAGGRPTAPSPTGVAGVRGTVGGDDDGAMTRAEEWLRVERVTEPWARAVLRIETVTEQVMVPVTVTRQQVRVEQLPVTAPGPSGTVAGPGAGTSPAAGQATPWVTLWADQPVVGVERRPVERVRLTTAWVTEEQTFSDQLRREEIALESPQPPTR